MTAYPAPRSPARRPDPQLAALAHSQVHALLMATPAFYELSQDKRQELEQGMARVATYTAELAREVCNQSTRLGQQPVLRQRQVYRAPAAKTFASAGETFRPAAANQIARVTQDTLRAVAFPTFVADLIRGTFDAITQSSIRNMEAYIMLLNNVSKTVDQFMADNITDNQARDYLASRYPEHIQIEHDGSEVKAVPRDDAGERPAPNFQLDLNLSESVSLDESSIEEKLVPAARRKLAESRLQLLSTLVLMGVNRIVVTGGKLRATMGFHIDTTDRAKEEHASDFDFRSSVAGSFGYGPWSASASTSIAYVSSTRGSSEAEINTSTDLTSEVEIHFKSDYFPVERFANTGTLRTIQGNTAVPEANTPVGSSGETVPWGGTVTPPQPRPRPAESARPQPGVDTPLTGVTRQPLAPSAPTAPQIRRYVEGEGRGAGVEVPAGGAPPATGAPPTTRAPAPASRTPPPTGTSAPTGAPATGAPPTTGAPAPASRTPAPTGASAPTGAPPTTGAAAPASRTPATTETPATGAASPAGTTTPATPPSGARP